MIRVSTRRIVSRKQTVITNCIALLASFVASMIIIACMGMNPLEVYAKILKGSLGSAYRFRETVNKTIPLAVLSLGTCVAFKMKFWNIGAEGQFYAGAFASTFVALNFSSLPSPVLIFLMFIAGFLCAGFFALIPAGLKIKWGTSETLVTLMLNYVAQKWVAYLQYGPWRDPESSGFPQIARFSDNAVLPKILGIHAGWLITILLAVFLFVLLTRTKFGYEVSVLGESLDSARYAGINVNRTLVLAVVLSGGLCGIAGTMQSSAIENSLTCNMSNGLGFTAVITTWLSKLNPILMIVVSFVFSMLIQGGTFLQSSMKIPASMAQILQGIIIFFVLGSEFFVRYRFMFFRKKSREDEK